MTDRLMKRLDTFIRTAPYPLYFLFLVFVSWSATMTVFLVLWFVLSMFGFS